MLKQDPYPGRQLRSLLTAALLSPCTRLIPGSAAALGGRTAWAGPLLALPPLLLFGWCTCLLRSRLKPGEGLPELALRRLGRNTGRAVLLLLGGWLLLYCGFTLRVGAERLLQDENFVLFCGTRLGKEPLTDLFQAYVELFHALTQMGAARQESKTDRGTGSGGSGGGPALSPDQQKALDEWNKAFPRLKMSAKEFLARV